MVNRYHNIPLLLVFFLMLPYASAGQTDTLLIHSDLPYLNNNNEVLLNVFYLSDSTFKGLLSIRFYKYESNVDSILILKADNVNIRFRQGNNKVKIDFSKDDTNTYYLVKFAEIIKRTHNLPPGFYKTFISVSKGDQKLHSLYIHDVDSLLTAHAPIRADINKSLLGKSKSIFGIRIGNPLNRATAHAGVALQNAKGKTDKAIRKNGMTSREYESSGKTYIDLFYQGWFAGRYEVQNKSSIGSQIKLQEGVATTTNFKSVTSNDLGSPSLFSQFKALNKEKKDQDEIKGEIAFNTNLSTGQEQYSDVDNNFYEIRGMVNLPILGMPVQVEGLYTSQDANRKVKSSYFRVHYNVDEMKDGLFKSISSYNTKFSETQSKSAGMTQVYQAAIAKFEGQKGKLQSEINAEELVSKVSDNDVKKSMADATKKNAREPQAEADTSESKEPSTGQKTKQKYDEALAKKKRLEEKRKQVQDLVIKIERYRQLFTQYQNTKRFDSTLGYVKTKDINSYDDMSYKQMAKRGSNLLPDGKAKSALAGLTSLDAGMFSKYESKYTMSGQQMKGLDLGYDIGFSEIGGTVGKTEYIGRDGGMDKYTFYSGRAKFKPFKDQHVGVMYYGYTADRKMFQNDGFFSNVNISAPGFFQPVHIVSLTYEGLATKYLVVDAEVASSFKNSDELNTPKLSMSERTAYHFNAEGNIPKTTINIETSYDKTGKGFENNTLPIQLRGTEQLKLAGRADIFRNMLSVGLEYNRLVQSNFASKGSNTKWGFDVRTNFKQYPNLALAYKPFTTFHSYSDTLSVPQRPLFGSVWTGKASYQLKRGTTSYRFQVLYNKSMTVMDTSSTGNDLMQAMCMYSDSRLSGTISAGYMILTGTGLVNQLGPNNTKFLNLALSYVLNKKLTVSGGQDFGLATFGLCRYSTVVGLTYKPDKFPIVIRTNMRFNTFKVTEANKWQQLFSGNLEMIYKFKNKMKDNR